MKILTQNGFNEFDGFSFMGKKDLFLLKTKSKQIECTRDHKFLTDFGEWKRADELNSKDVLNEENFIELVDLKKQEDVYDAINVENTNSFYAEGFIAHNCNFVYVDECGFVPNWEEFFASVFPTISSGKDTKILYTSTPNGLNHFYKIWDLAGKKDEDPNSWNGFHRFLVPWDKVPGRDEKWKERELAAMGYDVPKFEQEYACQFQGSSGTLISGNKLKALTWKTPLVEDPFGIKQYYLPEENHIYVCIVDVSRGKGLDYSAFSIIDVTKEPYRQVMVFRSNMVNTTDYTEIVYRFGKIYNEASILVEINDIGGQVADMLFDDYEYENILYTVNKGRSGKQLSGGGSRGEDRGVRTTKSVKAIGCSMLKVLIEQDKLIISDHDTIEELSTFSKNKTSYEAESGCHDDLVMGLVLFSWLTDQLYFKDLTGFDMIKRLREKSNKEMDDQLAPFGFQSNGLEEDEIETAGYLQAASW